MPEPKNEPDFHVGRHYPVKEFIQLAWEHLGRPVDGATEGDWYFACIELGYEPSRGFKTFYHALKAGIVHMKQIKKVKPGTHVWIWAGPPYDFSTLTEVDQ